MDFTPFKNALQAYESQVGPADASPPGYDGFTNGVIPGDPPKSDVGTVIFSKLPTAYQAFASGGGGTTGLVSATLSLFAPKNPNAQPGNVAAPGIVGHPGQSAGMSSGTKLAIGAAAIGLGAWFWKKIRKGR
jgi:hypothetical protein